MLLKLIGIPLVYQTYHSGIDHAIRLRTKVFRKNDNLFATKVLAVSERVRLDEIRAGVASNLIETMYLGISLKDFEGENLILQGRDPVGWNDPNIKKIITVGRFYSEKGMRYVVEAAIQVLKSRDNVVWWLVGKQGPESAYCDQIILESHMHDCIDCLGQRNDIPALMKGCDLQVVGSIYEGFGLMVLEAAACNVPTVGTQIGGMDEAILDGITGLLVERCDSHALAAATHWMLDHPGQRDLMGAAARQHVVEKFNAEIQIKILLKKFEMDLYA